MDQQTTRTVTSKDGTTIAFEQVGSGPALILVGGSTQHRAFDPGTAKLANLLAPHFTVYHYDRRGRGDSTDTLPFAVQREIEDIEALIGDAGGSAYLFGMSSGGALVLHATRQLGDKVKKIAVYEVPYNDDPVARQTYHNYYTNLHQAVAENRRGDAAALFLAQVGTPAEQIAGMRQAPFWQGLEAIAPTLAYDAAALGEESVIPTDFVPQVKVPALVMSGDAGYPFMLETAEKLAAALPNAQQRTLAGQTHDVSQEVLAPVLIEFYES
jgi:pimeloyl-ACP methyl ester carboxylesterase